MPAGSEQIRNEGFFRIMIEIILEPLAEGVEEGTINYWYFEEGDAIEEGADLLEILTEKDSFRVTAPCRGVLGEIYFAEGETVTVGDILCEIEEDETK